MSESVLSEFDSNVNTTATLAPQPVNPQVDAGAPEVNPEVDTPLSDRQVEAAALSVVNNIQEKMDIVTPIPIGVEGQISELPRKKVDLVYRAAGTIAVIKNPG